MCCITVCPVSYKKIDGILLVYIGALIAGGLGIALASSVEAAHAVVIRSN